MDPVSQLFLGKLIAEGIREQYHQRGDIWALDPEGFENRGQKIRPTPWLIIQDDVLCRVTNQIVVVAIRDGIRQPPKKGDWQCVSVSVTDANGLRKQSIIDAFNICTVKKRFFREYWGQLRLEESDKVDRAIKRVLMLI